jgi:hypothetical protein
MNILNELLMLSEAKEKNLIGLIIDGKKITKKTPSEPWPGDFRCSNNNLTSLVGAPSSVGGYFSCADNKLTSLVGAPSSVSGYFDCSYNKLMSLEGAPSSVGGYFSCADNQLTSLEGAPSSVGGYFSCSFNNITSLKGIEKILKKMNGTFYAYNNNPLKSHVIGLLLVPGCKEVMLDNDQVQEILNRHLKSPFGNKRVIDCQSELLDANLDEWAKL